MLSTIYLLVKFFNFLIASHRLFLRMKVERAFPYYFTLKIGNLFSFLCSVTNFLVLCEFLDLITNSLEINFSLSLSIHEQQQVQLT